MLLHLVVAELLAGLETDQDRARLVLGLRARPANGFRRASRSPSGSSSARRSDPTPLPSVGDVVDSPPMALAVDRYAARPDRDELLRRPRRPRRARGCRDRPGRRRGRAAARARPDGRALRRDPGHAQRTGTTSAASPTSPRGPARRSTCAEGERDVARAARTTTSPRASDRARLRRRTRSSQGGETLELAGHLVRDAAGARATRRATSRTTPTAASSPATCSSPARSGAPTSRCATGRRCVESIRALVERFPPETDRLLRPRAADDARRRARPQPVPRASCAPRDDVRGAPRHARHPPVRAAALAARRSARPSDVCRALRLPAGSRRRRSRTPSSSRGRRARARTSCRRRCTRSRTAATAR